MRHAYGFGLLLAACGSPEEPADPKVPPDPTESTDPPDPVTETTTPTPTTVPTPTDPPYVPPPDPVWLTFSGGGYHSHTAHSGVLMGLLEASGRDLTGLTENVVGVAASSGGTWFSTGLAYSEPFRAALEDEPDTWTTTGFLGQTEDLFGFDAPCAGYTGPSKDICQDVPSLQPIFAMGKISGATSLNWRDVVDGIYAPYGMVDDLGVAMLDSPRQAWADGKTLVFASAVLTEEVLLAQEPGFFLVKDHYTALATDVGVPRQRNFTPASFASPGANGVRPAFLPAGPLDVEYTTNEVFGIDFGYATIPADVVPTMTIVDAAAASSALGAAAASIGVLDESHVTDPVPLTNDEIAYLLRDTAPAFGVAGGVLSAIDEVPAYVAPQAALGALRLGDGVWIDDTAVAYAVRAMADAGTPDDFTIVSLLGGRVLSQRGAVPLPPEFERLFSVPEIVPGSAEEICILAVCVDTMSAAVFDGAALDAAIVRWTYTEGDVTLTHVELPVVTVDNPTFGVTAGHVGVVHLLVTYRFDALVFPENADSFATWAETLDVVRTGMGAGGGSVALLDVLGVK